MTATATSSSSSSLYSSRSTILSDNESEFVARFENMNTTTMSKQNSSTHAHYSKDLDAATALTAIMPDMSLADSSTSSFSSSANSSPTSSRSPILHVNESARVRASARSFSIRSLFEFEEQASIETPLDMKPYVTEERRLQRFEPYVENSSTKSSTKSSSIAKQDTRQPQILQQKQHQEMQQQAQRRQRQKAQQQHLRLTAPRIPRVTNASIPFQKTIAPTSYLIDELAKDPAYRHALQAGTLWQSLVAQHVRLPALWYDGEEPARPYLGCPDPSKRNKWSYVGRHRVAGDPKLNSILKDRSSSGKLLLHIVCQDAETFEPTEDIVVGIFHPNAEGIIRTTATHTHLGSTTTKHDNDNENNNINNCRDIWIGHRSRSVARNGKRTATRIESLLRHLNRNQIDKSPMGCNNNNNSSNSNVKAHHDVDNTNMNAIFGKSPPRHTIFVPENKLHRLLMTSCTSKTKTKPDPAPPATVILLRAFLP